MAIDKKFTESRKQSWPEVMARLKACDYSRGELKIFESYYVKGAEPKIGRQVSKWGDVLMDDDPIPLVYRLWMCPDQSDESWCSITERVLSYECPGVTGRSIKESRRLLDQYANSHYFNGIDAPAGFMGGAEKRIYRFLVGEAELGRRYTYNPMPKNPEQNGYLYSVGWFGFMYYVDMCVWLGVEGAFNSNSARNPFYLGCCFLGQWRKFLEADTGYYIEKFQGDERCEKYIKEYFAAVLNYPAPVDGGDDLERQLYCQEAREILDNANIPLLLKSWWEEVKSA